MDVLTISGLVAHVVVGPMAAGHALLYKRDSRAAFGWVSACLLFPLIGPIAYSLFGVNRVRSRAEELQSSRRIPRVFGYEREQPFVADLAPRDDDSVLEPHLKPLAALSRAVTGQNLESANVVSILVDGEQAYPRMLAAIGSAKKSVHLMTYILDTDRTGQQFSDALAAADKRGVDVRVIIDGVGDRYSRPRASKVLAKAGIRVVRFLPPRLFPPSLHLNLRNHQKLLIVDGEVAFAGGMNIGDRHLVKAPKNRKATQDLHFEFKGTILQQLHSAFQDSWSFVANEALEDIPGSDAETGEEICRVIVDGPGDNLDKLEIVMIGALATAQKSVVIMTPYFLPSREFISALKTTALKGASVTVVLPEKSNLSYVDWATKNFLGELVQHGIRVVRQPPPFSHAKLLIVDNLYCLVGSANIDARSLRLNFELGVEIISERVASKLTDYVSEKTADGKAYSLAELDGRSLPVRLRDAFFWLFSPYL